MAAGRLYNLEERQLGTLLRESPEEILRASSYEVEDAILRLSSEDFSVFIKNSNKAIFNHLVLSVSPDGVLVLFFRIPDEELDRFILSLKHSSINKLITLLMGSVHPDIILRRLSDTALFYILDSLEEQVLSQLVMKLSPVFLRRILYHGGAILELKGEPLIHVLSAYRMGDMVKWGVYIVQSLLQDIDKEAWLQLAPKLSGKDWNMVFTALSEDRVLELLRMLDRKTLKRLVRRIDKHLFMSFLLSVGDVSPLLDTLLTTDKVDDYVDVSLVLNIYKTDRNRALSILKRVPLTMISFFIKHASQQQLQQFIQMIKAEGLLYDYLFALDGEASFMLYQYIGDKEIYPQLLMVWLSRGLPIEKVIPREFVCKFVASLDPHQVNIPPGDISLCILETGVYQYLSKDILWQHLLAIEPSHPILKQIDIPWKEAPPDVIRHHRQLLSQMLIGIPDGMLFVIFEDGVPDDAPQELVKRWAFLPYVDTTDAIKVLIDRKMYRDAYLLMKSKDVIVPAAIPYILDYIDDEFIDDIILGGYGHVLIGTPLFKHLTGDKKAMVILSLDEDNRKTVLGNLSSSELWDIILHIDDIDILREFLRGVNIKATEFLKYKDKMKPSVQCLLSEYVEDVELLFKHWPEGVQCSDNMKRQVHRFLSYLDDDSLVHLLCSGDVPFSEEYSYLVEKMPISCLIELPEAWQYLNGEKLYLILQKTRSEDISLWQKIYESGLPVINAPAEVKYHLWKQTGDKGLLTPGDIMLLIDKYPDVVQIMPLSLWPQFIHSHNAEVLRYFPDEMWKKISEQEAKVIISHIPQKVADMLKQWDRQRVMLFLARYFPHIALEHITAGDLPYVIDVIDRRYLPLLIKTYPQHLWKYICRIDERLDVEIDLSWVDTQDLLECIRDKVTVLKGTVSIPTGPRAMKWLYENGWIEPSLICESIKVYTPEYIKEGYIPDEQYIRCIDVSKVDQAMLDRLINLSWWDKLPDTHKLDLLIRLSPQKWEQISISEGLAKLLLEKGVLPPAEAIKKGYSHLVVPGQVDLSDVIKLYKNEYLTLTEAYRLAPDIALHVDISDIEYLVLNHGYIPPEDVIPMLSYEAIYHLLRKAVFISYDHLPSGLGEWLVEKSLVDITLFSSVPERLKIDILQALLMSSHVNVPLLWEVADHIGMWILPMLIENLSAEMWKKVPPEFLAKVLMYPIGASKDIIRYVPPRILGSALKMLSSEDIVESMYLIRPYGEDILMSFSPKEVVSSPLKLLMSLASDRVFDYWIKHFPLEAYTYVSRSAYMYTVKNPCVLSEVEEEGIRRLVQAPEDIVLEIIRRLYRQCRDVSGKVIKLYGEYSGLRPSEILVKAGLVSGN